MKISKIVEAELRSFPYALDEAVRKKFGVDCNSSFDLFGTMNFVTNHNAKGKQRKEVDLLVEAYIAGNQELSNRIINGNA